MDQRGGRIFIFLSANVSFHEGEMPESRIKIWTGSQITQGGEHLRLCAPQRYVTEKNKVFSSETPVLQKTARKDAAFQDDTPQKHAVIYLVTDNKY